MLRPVPKRPPVGEASLGLIDLYAHIARGALVTGPGSQSLFFSFLPLPTFQRSPFIHDHDPLHLAHISTDSATAKLPAPRIALVDMSDTRRRLQIRCRHERLLRGRLVVPRHVHGGRHDWVVPAHNRVPGDNLRTS